MTQPPDPSTPEPALCPKCGFDQLIPGVRILDRGEDNLSHDLTAQVQERRV